MVLMVVWLAMTSTNGLVIGIFTNMHTMGKESQSTPFHRCRTSMFMLTAQVSRRMACKEWLLPMDGLFHSIFEMV